MIARNSGQTEPLVPLHWVPQNKYLHRKDLVATGHAHRGSHKNKGGLKMDEGLSGDQENCGFSIHAESD